MTEHLRESGLVARLDTDVDDEVDRDDRSQDAADDSSDDNVDQPTTGAVFVVHVATLSPERPESP